MKGEDGERKKEGYIHEYSDFGKKKKNLSFLTQEEEQEDAAVRINTRVIHTPIHRSILYSLGISTYYKVLIP